MSTYLYNNGNLLEPAVGDGQLLKFLDLTDYDQIEIFDIKNIQADNTNLSSNY